MKQNIINRDFYSQFRDSIHQFCYGNEKIVVNTIRIRLLGKFIITAC